MPAHRLSLLLSLVGLPWLIAACLPPLNHDSAAILTWAQRMLAGERLYLDLIDINPPMIFWLNIPPAALARWSGLPAASLLTLWYAGLGFLGLALALPLLPRLLPEGERHGFLAAAAVALLILPAHSFTQREHLLLLLAFPYLLHAFARAKAIFAPQMLGTATLFAIALCLKPHFLLIPAAIELYLLIQRRPRLSLRDPTLFVLIAVGGIYLSAALLFFPAYFHVILPTMARLYVNSGLDLGGVLWGRQVPPLLLGSALLGVLTWKRGGSAPRILLLFTLAATVSGIAQMKGWDYHFLPARGGLTLLAGWALGHWLKRSWLAPAIPLVSACLWSPPFALQHRFQATPEARLARHMHDNAPHGSILWLTASIKPQFTLVQALNQHYIGHYMSLWALPQLTSAKEGWQATEQQVIEAAAADFARNPDLLVVANDAPGVGDEGSFGDYLAYFEQDPRIAEALRAYWPIAKVEGWTLYRRTPTTPAAAGLSSSLEEKPQ